MTSSSRNDNQTFFFFFFNHLLLVPSRLKTLDHIFNYASNLLKLVEYNELVFPSVRLSLIPSHCGTSHYQIWNIGLLDMCEG